MPLSGTFRTYPLVIDRLESEDIAQLYSKGHHEQEAFMAAAQEWYDDYTASWRETTDPANDLTSHSVRHEWWATRVMGDMWGLGYSYFVNPVQPHERGAYPVTVIDL